MRPREPECTLLQPICAIWSHGRGSESFHWLLCRRLPAETDISWGSDLHLHARNMRRSISPILPSPASLPSPLHYILPLLLLLRLFWSCWTPSPLCSHWLGDLLQGSGPCSRDVRWPGPFLWGLPRHPGVCAETRRDTFPPRRIPRPPAPHPHLQLLSASAAVAAAAAAAIIVIIIAIATLMTDVNLTTICLVLSPLQHWLGPTPAPFVFELLPWKWWVILME